MVELALAIVGGIALGSLVVFLGICFTAAALYARGMKGPKHS